MRVRTLLNDDRTCGWLATLPPLPPARRLTGPQNADSVVVGAGFTGLAAARRLALREPRSRIVVVEAQRVGSGASGRNSGFLVDVGHWDDRLGLEGNRALIRLGRAGIDELREAVRASAIECAWTERGRLHGAVGDVGMRSLDHLRGGLEALREPFEVLDTSAVAEITGTAHYRAAIRTPGGVMVQPAMLVRGLASSLPSNVELFEESPVREVRAEAPLGVECAEGSVTAKRVLLATNGYTPSLGFLRRRMFPMLTFGSLTRPLLEKEHAALGGDPEWGVVPEERMGTTVRRTRDQRILIRSGVRYAPDLCVTDSERGKLRAEHLAAFRARFPALRDVDLEYTWGGLLGITMNGVQFFGRTGAGIFASAAYNGVGVAMGTACGSLLADLAIGRRSDLLVAIEALPAPAWIPPEPFLGIGVRLSLNRLQRRAIAER